MNANATAIGDISCLDGAETIDLYRQGSPSQLGLVGLRTRIRQSEPQPSGGVVVTAHAEWLLQSPTGGVDVRPGDRIVDAGGGCWEVLAVRPRSLGGGARCDAASVAINLRLADRVTIEQARWANSGDGPVITGWEPIRVSVPASIARTKTLVDDPLAPSASTPRYRVLLLDDIPLDHNFRVVGPDGVVYRVERYEPATTAATAVAYVVLEADPNP